MGYKRDKYLLWLATKCGRRCELCFDKKPLMRGNRIRFLNGNTTYWNWVCNDCFVRGLEERNDYIYQKTVCKWCGIFFFCVRSKVGRGSLFCSSTCALSYSNKNGYND